MNEPCVSWAGIPLQASSGDFLNRHEIEFMGEGFENMIQHVAKAEFLIDDGAAVRPADKGRGRGDLGRPANAAMASYGEIGPKTCDRDPGHPQAQAYSQQPRFVPCDFLSRS